MQGTDDEDVKAVNVHLQRVESGDLIVFPETAEGYVDKVRAPYGLLGN